MQVKKSLAILLSVFILFSNLGLAFNVHYCHEAVSSVSLNYQFKQTSTTSSDKCCSILETSKTCCSDKVIKAEKKAENILVKSFQVHFQNFIITTNSIPSILSYKKTLNNDATLCYYCDANAPPFYKLYCQLVFYA